MPDLSPTNADPFHQPFTPMQATIADAAIRVIARRGFDVVSVRTVAEEIGIASGTVQYHMPSRRDILVAAFARSVQRQVARIEANAPSPFIAEALQQALEELLPLDDARREDAVIWVAFGAAASTRDWLASLYNQALGEFRLSTERVLRIAETAGVLQSGVTPASGARVIAALVNGLTIDGINTPPAERVLLRDDLSRGLALIVRPEASAEEHST